MDDVKYIAHMFEEMRGELKAVHEIVADLPKRGEFEALQRDVSEIKEDVKVVKASVRSLSSQVHDHEIRIGRLETA
jgi:Protein of unknown function (DUF2730)